MTAANTPPGGRRWPVAILGATGAVGQTFIRLLRNHPWFDVAEVAASERSAGKSYRDAVSWLEGELPDRIANLTVLPCDPAAVTSPIVFSALDSAPANEIVPAFAAAGTTVVSNASIFRMAADVPLVIPEVNASHLALLDAQRRVRGWPGAIVTNANCAATVATMALAPLHEAFGIARAFVTTMQAVSGAGYPGVPSLDILGNVIPYIREEEAKIEREIPKMLGRVQGGVHEPSSLRVSAHANRVAVEHGHLACITVECVRPVSVDEAMAAMFDWRGAPEVRGLPSAPERPLVLTEAVDRPQTRRDVHAGAGMTVTVGRVRPDPLFHLRFVALGHNTIRGAAGGAVLNAELLVATGAISQG
jgi:aspartate-semialdehyde dehydrogenase